MTDQKLSSNINLGEIRYLGVSEITDYKLEFKVQKFKPENPIYRTEIIKINRIG